MSLIRTSIASAVETAIKLSSGLLVVKFISLRAGPEGLATFSQFQNFVAAAVAFCCGAFTTGLVKYVAEARDSKELISARVQDAVGAGLVLCFVLGVALTVFAEHLSMLVFGDEVYGWAFKVLAVALIPTTALQIILAVLNGRSEMLRLIAGKSAASLLLLTLSVMLVWAMGLDGALLSIVLAPAASLIVAVFLLRGVQSVAVSWFRPRLRRSSASSYWPFWVMSAVSVVSTPVILIFIRSVIGEQYGWHSAGLWEAAWKITELYLLVVTTALAVYFVPNLSAAKSPEVEIRLVNSVIVFAVATSTLMATFIFLLKEQLIQLLFSAEFIDSTTLIIPQLIASVIKVGCWVISYHIIIKRRVATFIVSELIFGVSFASLGYVLLQQFGVVGASYAYLLSISLYSCFCYFYYLRWIRARAV